MFDVYPVVTGIDSAGNLTSTKPQLKYLNQVHSACDTRVQLSRNTEGESQIQHICSV